MNENLSSRRIRWLVTLLCLTGAGAGGYFLWLDLHGRGPAGRGAPIARIGRRAERVRRKAQGSYVWNNVEESDELYRRDSIQTGAESNATVRFLKTGKSGAATLEIGENSLIVIDNIDELVVNGDGILRGNAVIRSEQGEDRRVVVGADGKAKVERVLVRLIKPEPQARMYSSDRGPRDVAFAWEARGDAAKGKLMLEVAPDRGFKSPRAQSLEANGSATLKLTPGRWFWRIVNAQGPLTETRPLHVAVAQPLTPTYPGPSQPVSRWGEESGLTFRWVQPGSSLGVGGDIEGDAGGSHTLEVFRDAALTQPLLSRPVVASSGMLAVDGLGDGRWFWRLKSRLGDVTVTSPAISFTIERAHELKLTQDFPASEASIEALNRVPFSWDCDLRDAQYRFELQTPSGASVVTKETPSRSFNWDSPRAGQFKWRVTALHKTQKVGETPWRAISLYQGAPLALREPEPDQKIQYWDAPTKFTFRWDADAQVKAGVEYQIELSRTADFRAVALTKKTHAPQLASEASGIEPGTWWWRLKIVSSSGETLKQSDPRGFTYGVYPPLKAPEGVLPASGLVYNPLEQEKTPVLSWQKLADAEGYEVSVYEARSVRVPASSGTQMVPGKLLQQTRVDGLSYALPKLKEGEYLWTVRGWDRLKRQGEESPPARLKVSYGEVLDAPEVTSSEVQ